MFRYSGSLTFASLIALAAGCTSTPEPGGESKAKIDPTVLAEGKKLLLASEPAGARSVKDVRKEAKDGDEVVVAGQIGGSTRPFTEGRASFLIVDDSLEATSECDCPWDFCELPKKELAAARVNVKFVGADGKSLACGAREAFGVKELSKVVVKGKVSRDDKDNVIVLASGIFVKMTR